MTAALLRCAADVIEKCAFDASDYCTIWGGTSGDEEIANTFSGHAGGSYEAEWIALMHPDIATPLAAWLRHAADDLELVEGINQNARPDGGTLLVPHVGVEHAIQLAKAILWEDR